MAQTLPHAFLRSLIQLLEEGSLYLDGDTEELERILYHFDKYTTGTAEVYRQRILVAIPILLVVRYQKVSSWIPMDTTSPITLRASLKKLEEELGNPWLMEHRLLGDRLGELHDESLLGLLEVAYKLLTFIEEENDEMAGHWFAQYVEDSRLYKRDLSKLVHLILEGV